MIQLLTEPIRTKKSFGQHLLTDPRYCERITRFADIQKGDHVVEIGAGSGILTRHLLAAGASVTAVEMDRDMIPHLSRLAASFGRLKIEPINVLGADWDRIIQSPVKFVGNLPYNISTRIIREMIPIRDRFHSATFTVQKEVAERLLAQTGDRDYGYFTVLTAIHFSRTRGFDVPPGAFRPAPRVTSAVLKLVPGGAVPGLETTQSFEKVLSHAFRAPRKTISNNLKVLCPEVSALEKALEACGIPPEARPNRIDPKRFLCLSRVL